MSVMETDDEIVCLPVELLLGQAEIDWLVRLHRLTGDSPAKMISSMLRDIRIDDEAAHGEGQWRH